MTRVTITAGLLLATASAAMLSACVQPPEQSPGLLDVAERPAEKALLAGLRAYDDAQYAVAEQQFGAALQAGLTSPKDRAAAHKHLAFIYCTTQRLTACEAAFRGALQVDPQFTLSKSEEGHPLWGPVYQRLRP